MTSTFTEQYVSTDILVIGGGLAGMFAAIKAREQGMEVVITDKGYIGKVGSSYFAEGDTLYFRQDEGHQINEWLDIISDRCEYINNREWDEICLRESKDRYDDMVNWGVPYEQKDGKTYLFSGPDDKIRVYQDITMAHGRYTPVLREKVVESGVKVLDRMMICDLVKQDEQLVGAVGFNAINNELYIFQAKAIVIATGSSNFKMGAPQLSFLTSDGEVMAYNAGAELISKEFLIHYGMPRSLGSTDMQKHDESGRKKDVSEGVNYKEYNYPFGLGHGYTGWYSPTQNAEGTPLTMGSSFAWEAHRGRAPLYHNPNLYSEIPGQIEWVKKFFERIGTHAADKIGMDVFNSDKILWPSSRVFLIPPHAGSGIHPVNTNCATAVPGLFAAGNCFGSMGSGASYAGMGFGLNHAMVTGARAGLGAAEYASGNKEVKLDKDIIRDSKEKVCNPLERIGGFSPRWLTQTLHGIIAPYYILGVKHEDRLQASITLIRHLKHHTVPKLMAKDAHELRLAHETKSMVLMAEMILMSSLFRTESRGSHFREDYPERNDSTWLAWIKLKDEQGEIKISKEPVPQKWRPKA